MQSTLEQTSGDTVVNDANDEMTYVVPVGKWQHTIGGASRKIYIGSGVGDVSLGSHHSPTRSPSTRLPSNGSQRKRNLTAGDHSSVSTRARRTHHGHHGTVRAWGRSCWQASRRGTPSLSGQGTAIR